MSALRVCHIQNETDEYKLYYKSSNWDIYASIPLKRFNHIINLSYRNSPQLNVGVKARE